MDARLFHQRARDCLRLAKECSDAFAREALLELAAEFKDMARFIEAEERADKKTRVVTRDLVQPRRSL